MVEKAIEQLAPGTIIEDHYRIDKVIVRGTAATVYKATQLNLDRPVAIKYLHGQAVKDDEMRSRFVREARALADLRHGAIVPIFDCGIDNGCPFFVLEYQDAPTLRTKLSQLKKELKGKKKKAKLPLKEALAICRHIVSALSWSHENSIIHRDVTPANIFVRTDGQALLGDFGMARIETLTSLTVTGSSLGSLGYRPPEVIEGQQADCRSDVFQVGLVLHEMITGKNPGAQRAMAQLNPLDKDDGIKFQDIDEVPQWCNDLIRKCLQRNPQDRYQSMKLLGQDLAVPPKAKSSHKGLRVAKSTKGRASESGRRTAVFFLFLLGLLALFVAWPRKSGPALEFQSIHVEAGIERVRVKVRTNLASQIFVHYEGKQLQGETKGQEHELVLAPLQAGKAYQIKVKGKAEVEGEPYEAASITYTVTPFSKPLVKRMLVTCKEREIVIRLVGPKYSAVTSMFVDKNGKEHPCAVAKAEGGAVLLRGCSLTPGHQYIHRWFVTDKVGTSLPQAEKTYTTLPLAKSSEPSDHFLGLYLHAAIEGKIPREAFDFLTSLPPSRICLVWPPATDVAPVIEACKSFQSKGWATDVLVHVQRVPKSRKKLLDALKTLLQQSKAIDWLYVGHFVDWGGWQSSADDLGRLMKTISFFAKRLSPSTKVRLGPVALSKDLAYFGGLVSGKSISEQKGFSMAVIPTVYDQGDIIGPRLARYRTRAEDMGCFELPWSAFVQQTISIQSVVDENVSFLRPLAVDVDKGKLPGTDKTHSVFAAPVTTGAVAAATLVDKFAQCRSSASETIYFQPSLSWCRKLSGKDSAPLQDPVLWSSWANIVNWLGTAKKITKVNGKAAKDFGLTIKAAADYSLYKLIFTNEKEALLLSPSREKLVLTANTATMKSATLVSERKSDDNFRAVTFEYRFNAKDEVFTCTMPTIFFRQAN